jgi:hypothetical protein
VVCSVRKTAVSERKLGAGGKARVGLLAVSVRSGRADRSRMSHTSSFYTFEKPMRVIYL